MSELLHSIHVGDRVTIVDRFGKQHTGRAVMRGPAGWVLNMGGPHGTPGIASPSNVVKVSTSRSRVRAADARRPTAPRRHGNLQPSTDPNYIIQGLYKDGRSAYPEFGYDNEKRTIAVAQSMTRDATFTGDHVRVLTRDGEVVWDSRKRSSANRRARAASYWKPDAEVLALAHSDPIRPFFRGQTVRVQAHGKTAVLKKLPGGVDYNLRIEGEKEHSRFGSLTQIQQDLAHFRLYGTLPRDTPARPW